MTAKEAIRILDTAKAEIEWSAPLEYQEALDEAIRALKDSEPIFHLECLRCKKPVGSYSRQTMDQVSYTHYSYCEDCLRKGLKMLKKQDALDKQSISAEQADHIAESGKKVTFKPGDKFLLELGAERKMFGEFEIAGTDLYVKADLLEKLTRYESEEQPERNTGTWMYTYERGLGTWECSECGYRENIVDGGIYKFCSACGVKMEDDLK